MAAGRNRKPTMLVRAVRCIRRAAPVVLGISLLTSLAVRWGLLDGFETAAIDVALGFRGIVAPPSSPDIALVVIDQAAYEKEFGGTSPLCVQVLRALLSRIVEGHPAVIGVDLDTDPSTVSMDLTSPSGVDVPIVWGTAAVRAADGSFSMPPEHAKAAKAVPSAVTAFPQDRDGVVRSYQRNYRIGMRDIDALPSALVKAFCERQRTQVDIQPLPFACRAVDDNKADRQLMNFSGDQYVFQKIFYEQLMDPKGDGAGWSGKHGAIRDKIVLLGGTYQEARDTYETPVRAMSGVELHAQATATELYGGGIRFANELLMFVLELGGGFLVALFHEFLPRRRAVVASVVGIPVTALLSSAVAFQSLSRWASFVPVLFGTFVHELRGAAKD